MALNLIPVLDSYGSDQVAQSIWDRISTAFAAQDGLAFYRHPTLAASSSSTAPDFVILLRDYQPLIIVIIRAPIDQIVSVEEGVWNFGNVTDDVFQRIDDHATTLRHRFEKNRSLRHLGVQPHPIIALPYVTEAQFTGKFGTPDFSALWGGSGFVDAPRLGRELSDAEWQLSQSVFQAAAAVRSAPTLVRDETATSMGQAIRILERQIAVLDIDQLRAAVQIAPGPQRIRGLAGTGKTVLLALKAATIHAHYPDKRILFTFHTQSLYNQTRRLITNFYRLDHDHDPDWDKIHIRHAWGSPRRTGVYYDLCDRNRVHYLSFRQAQQLDREHPFRYCCRSLLNTSTITPYYDFVLVDEGQDLPAEFFQVLYRLCREPHPIYFAYDEMQNLIDLELPSPQDLFGRDENGRAVVSLDGEYPGPMDKDLVLRRAYRCPRDVLMLAHAVGLGIHGPRGPLQMLGNPSSWEAVGYELQSGTFTAGEEVVLHRPQENSPNMLASIYKGERPFIRVESFDSRDDELRWLSEQITQDILHEGVKAEDIIVVYFDQLRAKRVLARLQRLLFERQVASVIPGLVDDAAEFAENGKVTLATTFRAKGNEAALVYLAGSESLHFFAEEVEARNRAFTAISRAKGWVTLTGSGQHMREVEREIHRVQQDLPALRFVFPDMNAIPRRLDASETTRRRRSAKVANQTVKRLLELESGALDDVDPGELQQLIQKLQDRAWRGES